MNEQSPLQAKKTSLELQNISKYYQDREALLNISIKIPNQCMCFLTGHSGAGKSTLLRIMGMLESVNNGRVLINNHDIHKLSRGDKLRLRSEIGFVFQTPQLLHDRNIFDNVCLPLYIKGYPFDEIKRRVENTLREVGLETRAREFPNTLSAGEQERLGIARVLVSQPLIILADEPTGNLDYDRSQEVIALLSNVAKRGGTVIVATHDAHLLERFVDIPLLTLEYGRLICNQIKERGMDVITETTVA